MRGARKERWKAGRNVARGVRIQYQISPAIAKGGHDPMSQKILGNWVGSMFGDTELLEPISKSKINKKCKKPENTTVLAD